MKTSHKYLAIAFATLLCSCNEGITPDVIESQVQISANITPCVLTRVTEDGTSFTNGDVIKVQNMDRESKNLATYTYSESTGKWGTFDELYWDGYAANTFNAWYPATSAYGSFTIPTDQTLGITEADWMTATASAKKADGTVNLSFNHNLAKVTVKIDSWSNEYSSNEKYANSLDFNSLSSVMSYDGTLSGDNVAKWVKAYVAQANTSFVAIIAPATYVSGDDIMQVYVNGSSIPLAVKTTSDLTIEAGKAYSFKLSVGKNLAEITSSVTIGEWDDVTLDDQQMIAEVIKKIDYVDEYGINHGEGVEIDGVVWAPVNCGYHATDYKYGKLYQWGRKYGQGYSGYFYGGELGQTYSDILSPTIVSGSVALEIGQTISNANNFYTSSDDWVTSSNDALWNGGNESNPIKTEYDPCPKGWRVPTDNELNSLILNKSPYTTNDGCNGYWFSGSELYSSSGSCIFFPAAGNLRYYDAKADSRGASGSYWSSKSASNSYAYFLYFTESSGTMVISDYKRSQGCSIRCVQDKKSEQPSDPQSVNLSGEGTANSYIVSEPGFYKFTPTKGNSNTLVGSIESVVVLWESFGTDVAPSVGDLVKNVKYENGYISFETPSTFKEGNAVIAAKDASGTILWSWHIWLTDEPQGQVYYNNAGTMMDRNLGATSATPGDIRALGLLYQWGRKDPFLGSSILVDEDGENGVVSMSTITWPAPVESDPVTGTIEYAVTNPTTFIMYNYRTLGYDVCNYDWYYTGSRDICDNTRWLTSENEKSVYDPCPFGWRVPDGGEDGVWAKAFGPSYDYSEIYDFSNQGMDFSGRLGSDSVIWYPFTGVLERDNELFNVGLEAAYLSSSPEVVPSFPGDISSSGANCFYISVDGHNLNSVRRVCGSSVRCIKE
ncbi:MAG: hypothetical protein IKU33_03275 [Bacteroidales bacterium]|nr:hypothetical protein [Bacteroidales bacterium]